MQAFWIIGGGVVVFYLAIIVFRLRRRQARKFDMGVISDGWIAQHRGHHDSAP